MDNKALISKFIEFCKADGIGKLRIIKLEYTIRKLSKMLKIDFDKATKDDIVKLVGQLESSDYKDWTKHDYKVILKKFYKWLNGNETFPITVSWIKTSIKRSNNKLPDDLLTVEDIDALIKTATNIRDKAFASVLYESGCRIGELLNLKIKHITFDKYSPIIIVSGKTGSRRIRLIDKNKLLKSWLEAHPLKDEPEAYVWISHSYKTQFGNKDKKKQIISKELINKPLEYHAVVKMLRELAKKSGIKKKVNPHNFRHSRATHFATKLTEAQMKQMFGWTQSSDMASIYVHLSGRDIDDTILKASGLLDEEMTTEEETKKNIEDKLRSNPEFRSKIAKLLFEAGK